MAWRNVTSFVGPSAGPVLERVLLSRGLRPVEAPRRVHGGALYARVVDRDTGEDRGERWYWRDEFGAWVVKKERPSWAGKE